MNNGNYTEQPPSFRLAANFFSMATGGGTRALHHAAPTRAQADKIVEARLAERFTADANDYIYSYDAARDYDPSPGLEKIKARVLAINAADDERNPIELGIWSGNQAREERPLLPDPRLHRDPRTRHLGRGKWWKQLLPDLLNEASTPVPVKAVTRAGPARAAAGH